MPLAMSYVSGLVVKICTISESITGKIHVQDNYENLPIRLFTLHS